jgi:hypothetical protein
LIIDSFKESKRRGQHFHPMPRSGNMGKFGHKAEEIWARVLGLSRKLESQFPQLNGFDILPLILLISF